MNISINGINDSLTPVGVGKLGTIIYDNVVFPGGVWFDLDGNIQQFEEVKLDAVGIIVNRTKEIVTSKVSGRTGTIKEYVTAPDFNITMNAIIAPDTFGAETIAAIGVAQLPIAPIVAGIANLNLIPEPIDEMKRISSLENIPERLAVECKFLNNIWNINYLVIDSIESGKTSGDTFTLQINAMSDFDVDLEKFG